MKKIFAIIAAGVLTLGLFFVGVPGASAQTITVTPTVTSALTDAQAEALGEQLMEQMMGSPERHQQMEDNITRNMGTEFLRQMHIAMGRQGSVSNILNNMGAMPMMGAMMGGFGSFNSMTGGLVMWISVALLWLLLIAAIVALIVWARKRK